NVLFPDVIKNSNCPGAFAMKAHNAPPGTAEVTLQRLNTHHRCLKMLLEKLLEDVHSSTDKDNIQKDRSESPGITARPGKPAVDTPSSKTRKITALRALAAAIAKHRWRVVQRGWRREERLRQRGECRRGSVMKRL